MKKLIKSKSSNWLPDYTSEDVLSINFEHLKKRGIKACMFDLDHTLLVYKEIIIDSRLVNHVKKSGMKLYIATNRRHSSELDEIAMQIDAAGIMHAKSGSVRKPTREYYKHAVDLTGLKPSQIAMIGDRLIQDSWGAKRAGITSILVGKFGPVRGIDHLLTVHDRLLPHIFASSYKDI